MKRSSLYFPMLIIAAISTWITLIPQVHAASFNPAPWDFTKVYEKASPAVVYILVEMEPEVHQNRPRHQYHDPYDFFGDDFFEQFFRRGRPRPQPHQRRIQGQGSGFIVSSDGYILTNNHVVQDAVNIRCRLNDGRELTAELVGSDKGTDIAVIKVEGSDLPYLELGNSDELQICQRVLAIGNPLGLQASASEGIISAVGRSGLNVADFEDFLQTDAAINRGNSGGPLIDVDGRVIGINTAIVAGAGGGYMGIGFAIPSSMARLVMDQLINDGAVTLGYVGIAMQSMTTESAEVLGLKRPMGVIVQDVMKHSPAEKAGIEAGDVILRFDGRPIDNPMSFRNKVKLARPGQKIDLEVYRQGDKRQLEIEIGSMPGAVADHSAGEVMGLEVQTLTPKLARKHGYRHDKGVIITHVEKDSVAERANLREGDLILHVNQRPLESADDFYKILRSTQKGERLMLTVQQGKIVRFITMAVG